MGDSISRFQYLDLIYGLSGNEEALQRRSRNPLSFHSGWPDWLSFFSETNVELSASGQARCDCHRTMAGSTTSYLQTACEVRRVDLVACNVSLSFIQVFGNWPVLWHEPLLGDATAQPQGEAQWVSKLSTLRRLSWAQASSTSSRVYT